MKRLFKFAAVVVVSLTIMQFPVNASEHRSKKIPNIPRIVDKEKFYSSDNLAPRFLSLSEMFDRAPIGRLNVPTLIQKETYFCGPAAVQQLLYYKGIKSYSQYDLARMLGTTPNNGTDFSPIRVVLNKLVFNYASDNLPYPNQAGYQEEWLPDYVSSQTIQAFKRHLKADIDANYPLIFWVDLSVLYPGSSGGHYVTGSGWKTGSSGEIQSCYFVDPWGDRYDSTYQGLKIISVNEMMNAMAGRGYIW